MKMVLRRTRLLLTAITLLGSASVHQATADPFPYWQFKKKLTAGDEGDGDEFGRAISISGDLAVIAARKEDGAGNNRGAAYVIDFITGDEKFKLTASDTANEDRFGQSVAVSGNIAVVGADQKNGMGTYRGSAYLFDVTTGSELHILSPSVVEDNAYFGFSCAIDGNSVVVGAPDEDAGGSDRGAVYVFNAATGAQIWRLTASDGEDDDFYGHSVAITGNYIIVGAPDEDGAGTNRGKVYVYDLTTGMELFKLTASELENNSYFGSSVAAKGDYLVVGSPDADSGGIDRGAAYIFQLSTQMELKRLTSSAQDYYSYFGYAVSISDDLVAVGAPDEDGKGNLQGAAYLFALPSGNPLRRISAPDPDDEDFFGVAVAVTNDYVLSGSEYEDNGPVERGATYVFKGTFTPPGLKAALLQKAKKLKKKAKAAKKKKKISKAKRLLKKAKKLIKQANSL